LKNTKNNLSSCVLIGDKGYLSADYQLDLIKDLAKTNLLTII